MFTSTKASVSLPYGAWPSNGRTVPASRLQRRSGKTGSAWGGCPSRLAQTRAARKPRATLAAAGATRRDATGCERQGVRVTTVRPTWGEVFQVPPNTTGDDLLRLPDDGSKYELYEGVLVREMTSPAHGVICQRLGFTLGLYAQTTGVLQQQRIAQNALFDLTLPSMTDTTAQSPDLAILRPSTVPSWSVPQDTPLLAIEVVSESQTLAELALKAQTYRQAGVVEVWVVDYKSRSIEVWNTQDQTTLHDAQTLTSALLPASAPPCASSWTDETAAYQRSQCTISLSGLRPPGRGARC